MAKVVLPIALPLTIHQVSRTVRFAERAHLLALLHFTLLCKWFHDLAPRHARPRRALHAARRATYPVADRVFRVIFN